MLCVRWIRNYEHENGYYRSVPSKWHYPYWGDESTRSMACELLIPSKSDLLSSRGYDNFGWLLESVEVEYTEGDPDCGNCLRRLNSGKW